MKKTHTILQFIGFIPVKIQNNYLLMKVPI